MPITAEEIASVKSMGFLRNRGTENFSARVITENSCLTAKELTKIAQGAQQFGSGKVSFTSRMTVEIIGIPYENIEPLRGFLKEEGLFVGGTGDKVRPVTACKGSVCVFGKLDTHALAKEIHDRFFIGYNGVKLPHKFKIGVGGCPHKCIKPSLNDVGLEGNDMPIYHEALCKGCKKCGVVLVCPVGAAVMAGGQMVLDDNICLRCGRCEGKCPFHAVSSMKRGIRIYLGGTWGKTMRNGNALPGIYSKEDALHMIEKVILLYKEQGRTKERLGKMIDRLGVSYIEKELLGSEILKRKAEILGE